MAKQPQRVVRVYTLPVPQFDHLKAIQRFLQQKADREAGVPATEADPHHVTNSAALAHVLHWNGLIAQAAARHGVQPDEFATALYLGDLVAVEPKDAAA